MEERADFMVKLLVNNKLAAALFMQPPNMNLVSHMRVYCVDCLVAVEFA